MSSLEHLPEPARTHLAEALATEDWRAAQRPLTEALRAVGWPEGPAPIPDATDLTEAQRALVVLLTTRPGTWTPAIFAMPQPNWNRRRWLGLDPPSVLEQPHTLDGDTAPLWRLALARQQDPDAMTRLLLSVPLPGRLEALRDLSFDAYGCRIPDRYGVAMALLQAGLGDDVASWAPGLADGYLDRKATHEGIRALTTDLCFPCFLPLARAGVPIEPRWEPWCPVAAGPWQPWSQECLQAVAPERRDAVLEHAFRRALDDEEQLDIALIALTVHRSRRLVKKVIAKARHHHRSTEAEVLRAAARQLEGEPALQALLTDALGALRPVTLKVRRVARPRTLSDVPEPLHPLVAVTAGEAFGAGTPADALFDADAELTVVELAEPRSSRGYTAILHHVDAGVVFRRGSVDVVARRIQGSVEADDAALADALSAAFAALPPPSG